MLTQKKIESAARERREKPYKLADGFGLYIEVPPTGSPRWRFKYRFERREKRISLGVWPAVSLKQARELREDARRQVARGVDPSAARQASREGDTFEAVAREWFAKYSPTWVESTRAGKLLRLEKHAFPRLGCRRVAAITAIDVLTVLRRLDDKGKHATVKKTRQLISQVMRYAVANGLAERDPTGDLRGALPTHKTTHHAAVTDPKALTGLLRALEGYEGQPATTWALRLAPLVFVRPGELRRAEWAEIDLDEATWTIPKEKLKSSEQDHVVPLARQAVEVLREAEALTGGGRYVFPSLRSKERPMSENTVNAALRRLGYSTEQATGHGFRATARTLLAEVLGYRAELIEHQLAHAVRDSLGRAYNRTQFLKERRAMMQAWADYLDGLKADAKVLPLRPVSS